MAAGSKRNHRLGDILLSDIFVKKWIDQFKNMHASNREDDGDSTDNKVFI